MDRIVLAIGEKSFTLLEAGIATACLAIFLLLIIALLIWRVGRARQADAAISAERQREIDDKMAELNAAHAELTGRLRQLGEAIDIELV